MAPRNCSKLYICRLAKPTLYKFAVAMATDSDLSDIGDPLDSASLETQDHRKIFKKRLFRDPSGCRPNQIQTDRGESRKNCHSSHTEITACRGTDPDDHCLNVPSICMHTQNTVYSLAKRRMRKTVFENDAWSHAELPDYTIAMGVEKRDDRHRGEGKRQERYESTVK